MIPLECVKEQGGYRSMLRVSCGRSAKARSPVAHIIFSFSEAFVAKLSPGVKRCKHILFCIDRNPSLLIGRF
jgi:hypothetical protein